MTARSLQRSDPMLVQALANGATHEEAARAAGVSLRTLTRRIADPSFLAQIDELHPHKLEGIAADLLSSTARAIKTSRSCSARISRHQRGPTRRRPFCR
jgi:hypothetical protein